MEKKRTLQFALILTVIALTLYNILPTVFFYTKPLRSPISKEMADDISSEIRERIGSLKQESVAWLHSYCNLLNIHPQSIEIRTDSPDLVHLKFSKSEEAQTLRKFLPRAGLLIPFMPAQLGVASPSDNPKEVLVQRRIGLSLAKDQSLFQYVPKWDGAQLSAPYLALIHDRLSAIDQILSRPASGFAQSDPIASYVSTILEISALYPNHPEFAHRLATRLALAKDPQPLIQAFERERDALKQKKKKLNPADGELSALEAKESQIALAETFLKNHPGLFRAASDNRAKGSSRLGDIEAIPLSNNPLFHELAIDWAKNRALLRLYPDVASILAMESCEEKQIAQQLFIDEAASISRIANEELIATQDGYAIPLQQNANMTGLLVLGLDQIAKQEIDALLHIIRSEWKPSHPDLSELPIVTAADYRALSPQQKSLCLLIQTSITDQSADWSDSIYIYAKGIGHILRTYEGSPDSPQARAFIQDFQALAAILANHQFQGSMDPQSGEDFIFEQNHIFSSILAATREPFRIFGSKHVALLELSNVEERIIAENKIETRIHEELLKWNDEYRAASVGLNPAMRLDVPKPTRNIMWSNIKLSLRKLWRGDERKILRWGLDLSGGKSVQIELRDQNNSVVKDESDIKQGINELYNRVNKMGVSDVSIRRIGHQIALDFPGSQSLSASDLVKASSMVFHVVNERFSSSNKALSAEVDRFLSEVWNQAIVERTQDPDRIESIAYNHLYSQAPSSAAKALLAHGLSLANPQHSTPSKELDETLSKVVLVRDAAHMNPLLIVFHNHVLEGSNLDNIRSNYDPSKGNFLSFEVTGSAARSTLFQWTSLFSKESVLGTHREAPSSGRGWRMAVLLNGTAISAPTLESPLQTSASISGSFSQREVNQLVSDLKAGSLTFTPKILSEKNISPELGKSDRTQGIIATIVALLLVIGAMLLYYRFAGLIASIAVCFNLLILWAVLQNLGASLSLAGIAGIILTVGMAVDANVLVFERMKEELAHSGRIAVAIRAGYEKAFSAIVDSNVTTIIAALILLNFDAGPIKAFAITMIIGIASSMFTALFMTRFYFNGWRQNPRHTSLSMAHWIRGSNFNFLKRARPAFFFAGAVIFIGGALFIRERATLFGMDFTGGYALPIELSGFSTDQAVEQLEQAFINQGALPQDIQIRKYTPTNYQIFLGTGTEMPGRPFHGLPLSVDLSADQGGADFSYQKNPRIHWVVDAIEQAGLEISDASKQTLDANWTVISGQMSESMRNNAILGLSLAFLGIFLYIAFRFEYKYAIAALLCLLHDVLITLGSIGLLHAMGVSVQVDLNTIAALMTIIGYSLNDTIIIFDRVREDIRLYRSKSMRDIVNLALNSTLSRTTITSGTTLLVLLALLILGGASIFNFALVMVIGIVFGTLSSWFIAAPLLLFFHQRNEGVAPQVPVLE